RQARRSAGPAADQVRTCDQSQDRQSAWRQYLRQSAHARRRGDRMKRRAFIALIGGAAAWPFAARAQQAEKKYTVGILSAGGENTALSVAFADALRELGWVEGRNVVFEYRYAENRPERLPELAADLVRLKVDVIAAAGTLAPLAAKRASAT